jgi:putative holliday junction resolvase
VTRDHATVETSSDRQPIPESSGKLLGLDVGLSRIGVAVCDPLQLRARPLTIVGRASRREDFERLARLVRVEEAQAIICGLPLNMDGSEGDQARTVRKWAMRLAHALRALLGHPVPIIFWDERLSSFAAQEFDAETSAFGEDAVAAAVILQRYLDRGTSANIQNFGSIVLPAKEPSRVALHGSPGT